MKDTLPKTDGSAGDGHRLWPEWAIAWLIGFSGVGAFVFALAQLVPD